MNWKMISPLLARGRPWCAAAIIVLAAAWAACLPPGALIGRSSEAAAAPQTAPPVPESAPSPREMDLLRADRALSRGEYERALTLYRALWDRGSREDRVARGVAGALLELRRYEDLEAFVAAEGQNPLWGPGLKILSGDGFARRDSLGEASARWREALSQAAPQARLALLEEIAALQLQHGMVADHLHTLLEVRTLTGQSRAYARRIAEAYERAGNPAAAASEWLNLILASPADRMQAERRLLQLMKDSPATRESIIETLAKQIRQNPGRIDLRETLVAVRLDGGECESALEEALRREEMSPTQGFYLLGFAETAARDQCAEAASRTCREIRRLYPGGNLDPQVELGLARLLEATGDREQAAEAYLRMARARPRSMPSGAALLRAADLYLAASRAGEALELYEDVIARYGGRPEAAEARWGATDALVALGRSAEAKERLDEWLEGELPPADEERARFRRGRIQYFQEEFAGARADLEAVVDKFPEAALVNDCLELLLLLDQGESAPEDLRKLARGERLAAENRADAADQELRAVAESSARGPLWAEAELRRAALLRQKGETERALASLERVAHDAEEEPLRARALQTAAEIAQHDLHDAARARSTYEKLLVEHPDSYLADQARRALRDLEPPRIP